MKTVTSPTEIQEIVLEYRSRGLTIGLVPTMGWFHDGHLSLMREAGKLADRVITSLFINPIQFGPSEDLDNYPYDLNRDQELAEKNGVDILFAPEKESMYPQDFASTVSVGRLTSGLCGSFRPGHFDGVTTVVAKLFNLTLPHVAVFGEKDFQQLAVIRKMVRDLDFPVKIAGHPIVRDANGLAMSSRNTYLHREEMAAALSLSESITKAKELVNMDSHTSISAEEIKNLAYSIIDAHPECTVEYVEIVNALSLEPDLFINDESVCFWQ